MGLLGAPGGRYRAGEPENPLLIGLLGGSAMTGITAYVPGWKPCAVNAGTAKRYLGRVWAASWAPSCVQEYVTVSKYRKHACTGCERVFNTLKKKKHKEQPCIQEKLTFQNTREKAF